MIRQLRSSAKLKKVLWVGLLLLIIPSFIAVVGTGNYGTGNDMVGPNNAVTIRYPSGDESTVDSQLWRSAEERAKSLAYQYALEKNIPIEQTELSKINRPEQVLREALSLATLRDYGLNKGLSTSREEIYEEAQASMSPEERANVAAFIQQRKLTIDQYLEPNRTNSEIEKIAEALAADARVTHYEAWLDYQYKNEKLTADVAKVDVADYSSSVTVTDDALKAFFEQKKEEFKIPDQYAYSYIMVRKDDLAASASVTEDEVTSYYANKTEEFRLPRKAEVRQVFLRMPAMQDVETSTVETLTSAIEATRVRAEDIYDRAAKGEAFASLADQFSQETNFPPRADENLTTATDALTSAGGYLGLITEDTARGWYGDEWTTTVFNSQPNTLSRPVETQRGFYVLRVEKIVQGEMQPLDQVRQVVEDNIRKEKTTPLFDALGLNLVELSEKHTGLQGLADATSLSVKTTSKVDKETNFIPGIGLLGELRDAVLDVQNGGRSEVLTDANRHLVIELRGEYPSHIPELETVRAKVETAFRTAKAIEMAREVAEKIKADATDGESLKVAAVDNGSTVTRTAPFKRDEVGNGLGPVQLFPQRSVGVKKGDVILSPLGPDKSPQGFVVWHLAEVNDPPMPEFNDTISSIKLDLLAKKRDILMREFFNDRINEIGDNVEVAPGYLR